MGRVRKSSAGDIPVLMPDGKPSRRTGRGRRVFLFSLMGILAAAAIAALVMLLGTGGGGGGGGGGGSGGRRQR